MLGFWLTAVFSLLSKGLHLKQQKSDDLQPQKASLQGLEGEKAPCVGGGVGSAFLSSSHLGRFAPEMHLEGPAPCQK